MKKTIEQYSDRLPRKILDDMWEYVSQKNIALPRLKKIMEQTVNEYQDVKVCPGESVGVIDLQFL